LLWLDHRIAAVGSDEEIRVWAGPATQLIDLDGRLLVPGLIEGHGHFMSFGRAQQIIDLNDVQNWQEAVGRVAGCS
jgi:predicted amidohydrolase YtcJ